MATVIPGTPALARHQRTPALLLETIRDLGGVTRADLSRRTGLSRSAVAHAVAALLADGLIAEREPGRGHAGQRGRPATLLMPSRPPGHVVGIDFGHAHVGVAIADTAGEVLAESRLGADVDHHADEALDTSARMTRYLLSQAGVPLGQVVAVVAGIPGPVDPRTRALRPPAILAAWAGRDAGHELVARLGRPVEVANDADLGALGELRYGAGRGRQDFVYVKASHGVGAGLVLGGRIYRGAAGIAGEIGHTSLPDATEWCRCGNRGCLETVVSLGPLSRRLARIGIPPATGGAGWPVSQLQENALAVRALTEAGRILGRALADLCNCLNPEAVILGGEIGTAGPPLVAGVRESIDRYAQPAAAEAVQVLAAGLGARSELMGAVALAAGQVAGLR
jgi:predicted NBD/HSP70 family sugar kinase/biotin operon repressor